MSESARLEPPHARLHRDRGFRRLPRLAWRSLRLVFEAAPREFSTAAALQLAAGVGLGVQLILAQNVLEDVLAAGSRARFGSILARLAVFAVLAAFVAFANAARGEQQRLLGDLVSRTATHKILAVTTAVDLLAFDTPSFQDRLQRAHAAAGRPLQIVNGVMGLVGALFAIAGVAIGLLLLQPVFVLLTIAAHLPTLYALRRGGRLSYEFAVNQTERDRRRFYLFHVLSRRDEAKEVRAFGLGSFLGARHDGLFDQRVADMRRLKRRRLRLALAGTLATSLLAVAAVALLVWFVVSGATSAASAGAALGGMVLLTRQLQALSASSNSLYEGSLFLEDFSHFVQSVPERALPPADASPPPTFSSLSVEGVSFTYPNSHQPTLKDVSLQIGADEIVALVGENGSGKTTLAKLLAGLYRPDDGVIRWNGRDITEAERHRFRSAVAVVFQDFVKYLLPARENVAVGRSEWRDDLEAVVEAARRAGAHRAIVNLNDGYDTLLGPEFYGGTDLSVGQWQRVALARAFFREAPFIILDEPTAALDAQAELELFQTVRSLCRGRSVLLISHRFSSVRSADRIYVLAGGRIVEHGSHRELMAHGGRYAYLFSLQASAFVDSPA